jgi:hypothetical protein
MNKGVDGVFLKKEIPRALLKYNSGLFIRGPGMGALKFSRLYIPFLGPVSSDHTQLKK